MFTQMRLGKKQQAWQPLFLLSAMSLVICCRALGKRKYHVLNRLGYVSVEFFPRGPQGLNHQLWI